MTTHPAVPRYPGGYRPTINPTDWRDELDDIADMASAAGFQGPLRDVMAHLLTVYGTTQAWSRARLDSDIAARAEELLVADIYAQVVAL